MKVGLALMVLVLLWPGELPLGAPSNTPALEWAFGGISDLLPFFKHNHTKRPFAYIEVDGLRVVVGGLRGRILRQILRKI